MTDRRMLQKTRNKIDRRMQCKYLILRQYRRETPPRSSERQNESRERKTQDTIQGAE